MRGFWFRFWVCAGALIAMVVAWRVSGPDMVSFGLGCFGLGAAYGASASREYRRKD